MAMRLYDEGATAEDDVDDLGRCSMNKDDVGCMG